MSPYLPQPVQNLEHSFRGYKIVYLNEDYSPARGEQRGGRQPQSDCGPASENCSARDSSSSLPSSPFAHPRRCSPRFSSLTSHSTPSLWQVTGALETEASVTRRERRTPVVKPPMVRRSWLAGMGADNRPDEVNCWQEV